MPSNLCLAVAAAMFVNAPLICVRAQDSAPAATRPSTDAAQREADEILTQVDRRIYRSRDHGLKDVQFRWNAKGDGSLSSVDFWVCFWWKEPPIGQNVNTYTRTELFNADGSPMTEVPAAFKKDPGALQSLAGMVEGLAIERVIGLPYVEAYRNWYKAVSRREVNNKIETRIEMVPAAKKHLTRIVLKFRDGPPYEEEKTTSDSNEHKNLFHFVQEGDLFLLKSWRTEAANTIKDEETYSYAKVDGVLVLQSVEKRTRMREGPPAVLKLEALKVNQGLPVEMFKKSPPTEAQVQPKDDAKK